MNSDRGNREWLNDYMSLKQVNANNPFTVPEGYFDELEQQILSYVKLDELKKSNSEQGFTVPENYFEDLSSTIQARISVEEALDKENNHFTVPEGYFETLEQQIQSRIFVEEALSEQPEVFTVPQDYFNTLTTNILDKTVNEQPARQKGVVRRMFASVAFKYATAACLVLAVGGTIILSRNGNSTPADHNSTFLHKSLSAIPVDEIQTYLQSNIDPTDPHTLTDDDKVNADNLNNDLEDYLDTTSQ